MEANLNVNLRSIAEKCLEESNIINEKSVVSQKIELRHFDYKFRKGSQTKNMYG